jgi:hypothetical protein
VQLLAYVRTDQLEAYDQPTQQAQLLFAIPCTLLFSIHCTRCDTRGGSNQLAIGLFSMSWCRVPEQSPQAGRQAGRQAGAWQKAHQEC